MKARLSSTVLGAVLCLGAALPAMAAAAPAGNRTDLLPAFLDGPMRSASELVFAVRKLNPSDGHWYANFGNYGPMPDRKAFRDGAKLLRLNLRTGNVTTLLEDAKGGVRDPQAHYDGEKILFSYRRGGSDYYHLYEIGIDGSGMRQLTDGPFDDIE